MSSYSENHQRYLEREQKAATVERNIAANTTARTEWADGDADDGDTWPYPTEYVKRELNPSSELATRIRVRLGVTDQQPVFITEAEISGGWSEYTQETDYAMTIECGQSRKEFESGLWRTSNLVALLEWLDAS